MTEEFLLDTSTLIWALAHPGRLSRTARTVLMSGRLLLSVASYWEASVKAKKGRLSIDNPTIWWQRAVEAMGAEVLPVRATHVTALNGLPDHHKDPFDRILIAQAVAEGLVLVTSDETMHRYPVKLRW